MRSKFDRLLRWLLVVPLWLGLPTGWFVATAGGLRAEPASPRLLLQLPRPLAPTRTSPYRDLRAADRRNESEPVGIAGADGVSQLLQAHGVAALARLGEGLAEPPAAWDDWYVVAFDPPLSREDAERLALAVRSADSRVRAEVDAAFEPLAVEEAFRPLPRGRSTAPQTVGDRAGAPETAGFLPNDPLFADGTQWGLSNDGTGPLSALPGLDVRAPGAWARTTGNTAIRVGTLDTGIDDTHPDLVRPIADGTSRLFYKAVVTDDGSGGKDTHYHGTAVLGVMAALTNNGASLDGLGVAGVIGGSGGDSTGARILSIKITAGSEGTAAGTDMARAIVNAHLAGAHAVNLSFAGDEPSDAVRTAMAHVAERGTIVVCGAGNSANSLLHYPGSYSRFGLTLSVGAMAPDGTLAVFSTRGDQLDVVAPGQDVATTWLTYANAAGSPIRNYQAVSGTSFAAPFVTGALGLAAALGADLRANDYQEVVRRTATDWGVPGRDSLYGNGLLDVESLLDRLAPPRSLRHGSAAAGSWSLAASDSLTVVSSEQRRGGHSVNGAYEAEVWEVRVPVSGLYALLEPPEAWVRYTGPGGWSRGRVHEFDYAWGELIPGSLRPDGFDLRTYAYYVAEPPSGCPACPAVGWLPRSPQEVLLDWTAWSRFDAPPALTVFEPQPDALWESGEHREVRWQASDPDRVTRVEIAWVADGGTTVLASSPDSAGTLQVTVPCRTGPSPTRLRVTAFDASGLAVDETAAEVPVQLLGAACNGETVLLAAPEPNPARGAVRFPYWLPDGSPTAAGLRILDVRGREVAHLSLDVRGVPAEAVWNGFQDDGRRSPSGVYWAVLEDLGGRRTERFVWLR